MADVIRVELGEEIKRRGADPKFAKARDERVRERNADPEFAKARDEKLRQRHAVRRAAKAALADIVVVP